MSYPSDLKDAQWELIRDHFDVGNYGNRGVHEKRQLVNAVFYLVKTGCQWRQLPKDFPHWSTVHSFYYRMKKKGIWEKIMADLVKKSRVTAGRNPDPSYALIDSQSVKTTNKAEARGIDGGKKVKGRKRHIVTDTLGHMLHVQVHAANTHDTVGGCPVLEKDDTKISDDRRCMCGCRIPQNDGGIREECVTKQLRFPREFQKSGQYFLSAGWLKEPFPG